MADVVQAGQADLALMGIRPTYPSAKYGYVVPECGHSGEAVTMVSRFVEKPDVPTAERLIADGAYWNGGVFAFRLGYLMAIVNRYVGNGNFNRTVPSGFSRQEAVAEMTRLFGC